MKRLTYHSQNKGLSHHATGWTGIKQKCIGRESNPGLADILDLKISNGNGQFYH